MFVRNSLAAGLVGLLLTGADLQGGEVGLSGGWNRIYLTEGRDNLGEESLGEVGLSLSGEHWELVLNRLDGLSSDYLEWSFEGYVDYSWEEITTWAGLRWIQFKPDDLEDVEIELGFAVPVWIASLEIATYYSREAQGNFLDLRLLWNGESESLPLSWSGGTVLGLDFGYATAGKEGFNHIGFVADLELGLSESAFAEIGGEFAHPLDVLRAENLSSEWNVYLRLGLTF